MSNVSEALVGGYGSARQLTDRDETFSLGAKARPGDGRT
jgi:hypothetical protein